MADAVEEYGIYDEDGAVDFARLILVTALRSAYRVFVIFALIIVLVIGMLPLESAKFFDRMGLKERALYMSKVSVERQRKKDTSAFSEYADALYYKMMLSEELFLSADVKNIAVLSTGALDGIGKKNKGYLFDSYSATYEYALISGIEQRNALIDQNNLSYVAPFAHANVFSFRERVSRLNYYAALRLGKSNEFLIGDRMVNIVDIAFELAYLDRADIDADFIAGETNPVVALDICIFLSQLTEYINYNLSIYLSPDSVYPPDQFGFDGFNKAQFIALMDILIQKAEYLKDFALDYTDSFSQFDSSVRLYALQTQLYMVKVLGQFYDQMYEAARFLQYNTDNWFDARYLADSQQELTLTDYFYSQLLIEYLELFYTK